MKSKSQNSQQSESEEEEDDIPPSITILLKSHEFLGRHGCCCISQGKLLIFIMKLVIPKLGIPLYSPIKDKLKRHLEQIFFCLYGHPIKFSGNNRPRPKRLDDHCISQYMDLSWDASQLLFEFYKPHHLPGFESKRIDSISADTVNLFKKICQLVPRENNPDSIVDQMKAYIQGNDKKMPGVEKPLHSEISLIWYLIADHYFKMASNHSWETAIKYYTYDLCLHPNELNSWAGLAMATGTVMEMWLNTCNPNM